jgi:hypothetical protein
MSGAVTETLRQRNMRLIAGRTGWPEGALEACEEIEAKYPDWSVDWRPENRCPGFEHPTGYFARTGPDHPSRRRDLFAVTAEDLLALLDREP